MKASAAAPEAKRPLPVKAVPPLEEVWPFASDANGGSNRGAAMG